MNVIRDKRGREYHVLEDASKNHTRFNIKHSGNLVGYANCRFLGCEILHLDDIHINDEAIRPPWFFVDLLFWVASIPPERLRTTNYRRRGVGTAMIEFLVGYARSKSIKRIEGKVKRHDFEDNPDLPDWYRRRGFNVVMADKNSGYIAKISRIV